MDKIEKSPVAPAAIRSPKIAVGSEPAEEVFKPTGAFAFFVLLVILGLIIWFGIYFLMLNRI